MDVLDRARELLENVTPMKTDCGKICGAACCQPDEEDLNGMLLFPGEERYYREADWCRLIPHGICSFARGAAHGSIVRWPAGYFPW